MIRILFTTNTHEGEKGGILSPRHMQNLEIRIAKFDFSNSAPFSVSAVKYPSPSFTTRHEVYLQRRNT